MSERYKFQNQQQLYFITPTVVQWADLFTRERYRKIIIDSLNYCVASKGLIIHAWVLMTNHLHLIIGTTEEPMEHILRDMKKFTSKALRAEIEENGHESRDWLMRIFHYEGNHNSNNNDFQLWQNSNHPIELWKKELLIQKLKYIHENPVRAGYVASPEHWLYSSAVDYWGGKGLVEIEPLIHLMYDVEWNNG